MSATPIIDTDRTEDLLRRAALTQAEFSAAPRSEHTQILHRIIEEADVVLGLYFDGGSIQTWIIKGEMRLKGILISDFPQEMNFRVIPISVAEEAEAMRRVLGDGARVH